MTQRAFTARILALSLLGAALVFGVDAKAQTSFDPGVLQSAILTIDSERVFLESDFGQRVARDIEAKNAELTDENRRIYAALEEEEKELTKLRETLAPEDFKVLANSFDQKVVETRAVQTAKGQALSALLDQEREVFLTAAAPILNQLMQDANAVIILDRRAFFLGAASIDITDDAIQALNETLGRGETPASP